MKKNKKNIKKLNINLRKTLFFTSLTLVSSVGALSIINQSLETKNQKIQTFVGFKEDIGEDNYEKNKLIIKKIENYLKIFEGENGESIDLKGQFNSQNNWLDVWSVIKQILVEKNIISEYEATLVIIFSAYEYDFNPISETKNFNPDLMLRKIRVVYTDGDDLKTNIINLKLTNFLKKNEAK